MAIIQVIFQEGARWGIRDQVMPASLRDILMAVPIIPEKDLPLLAL